MSTRIIEPKFHHHVNVAVTDQRLTARLWANYTGDLSLLNPKAQIAGDSLWDVLAGKETDVRFPVDYGASPVRRWALASVVGAGAGAIVEIEAISIPRDPIVIGRWAASDGLCLTFMTDFSGKLSVDNRRRMSSDTHFGGRLAVAAARKMPVVTMNVPYTDTPWTKADFTVMQGATRELWAYWNSEPMVFGTTVQLDPTAQGYNPETYEPKIDMRLVGPASIEADEAATVAVTVNDAAGVPDVLCNSVVYLDAVSGYLPSKRLTLNKGTGSFRAVAFGLWPREVLRIKAGWRDMPALAEFSCPVTEKG